jgi:hypothetical protein
MAAATTWPSNCVSLKNPFRTYSYEQELVQSTRDDAERELSYGHVHCSAQSPRLLCIRENYTLQILHSADRPDCVRGNAK